ncbi:hypothetical protein AB3R30_26920, partial [Leptolyngbyaceae cyanobacterium UHCC 1019]
TDVSRSTFRALHRSFTQYHPLIMQRPGSVRVNADSISLDGVSPDREPSGIGSEVGFKGTGRGGDVWISSDLLSISNGAKVSTTAFGGSIAGNIGITVRTLNMDQGEIASAAFSGDGANITLNIGEL